MNNKFRLPDFLIIGAGKSGTTAILFQLGQHPQVFFPTLKEPNFLALEGVDINDYEFEESREYHLRSIDKFEDYVALFKDAKPEQLVGENSNQYIYSERAIENIKKYMPKAKLIALIRHPAERLISRYSHLERNNAVPTKDIEAVFDRSSIWWRRPDLIPEGFYGSHLEKYFANFDRDQLKVILYDDFKADNAGVLREVCEYIGVDPDFEAKSEVVVNKSGKLKDNLFNKMLGQNGAVINTLKKVSPSLHKAFKGSDVVKQTLIKWRNKNLDAVELPKDFKQRVTEEIYKEDIQKLEKVLGRSLKHWYTF